MEGHLVKIEKLISELFRNTDKWEITEIRMKMVGRNFGSQLLLLFCIHQVCWVPRSAMVGLSGHHSHILTNEALIV
jgi:hypothetical protein